MKLTPNQKLHGFTVTRIRHIEELNADLYEMLHDVTGTELCWFDDGDENKLFSIAFKTIPEDSTGVFHILEHTVLNGSDRYPVKEPFVELLKSSLNTFLNAMTFPDKTMYPVSSRNTADFINLTRVYLDAVFHPLIGKNQNIFRQEGWHIELTDKDSDPIYKGVVFNEMKGATSSVDDVVEEGVSEMLFPDNCYHHNSGGDPRYIPDLTYEQYLDTYARFYHPSNARIWLDGDIPLEETLALINDEYLSNFTRREENHDIPLQQLLPAVHHTVYSELSNGESPEGKSQLVFSRIAANWNDYQRRMALTVLCDALCGSNEAPLSRAILEANLGQDVSMALQDGIAQPFLTLRIHNTDNDKEQAIREVIRATVSKLLAEGIDRKDLEAILNKLEFEAKQPREPQGLIRNIQALSSWLYGGDPVDDLVCRDVFQALRDQLSTRYWEDLLAEILDEAYLCLLHVLPSATLGEDRRKAEAEQLAAIRAAWTEEETEEVIAVTKNLIAWQQAPDSPESLATIPVLPLSEISPEPETVPTAVETLQGVKVLTHRMNCKGIVHVSMYFNMNDGDFAERTLLPILYGSLPTAKHDARSLQQEMKRIIGANRFTLQVYGPEDRDDVCTACLCVRFSVLEGRLQEATDLMLEILTSTCFDDTAKIKELVLQSDEQLRQSLVTAGHMMSILRAGSHYTAQAAMQETLSGITHIQWIHDLATNFDTRIANVVEKLRRAQQKAVCRSRLILSVASDKPVPVDSLLAQLPEGTPVAESIPFSVDLAQKEGIVIPAQISYAGIACKTNAMKHGSISVLRTIANYSYLWTEVRVKGGAYGSGMTSAAPATLAMYSFRDPAAANTLKTYRAAADWLDSFLASGESLEKSIISSVGTMDRLSTAKDKAATADMYWLSGITDDYRRLRRAELIATTPEALSAWKPVLENLQNGAVCVIGHKEALEACKDEDLVITEI